MAALENATELPPVSLVLGGARSGKSAYAETLAESHTGPCIYLATAEAGDDEMAARIAAHQARRGERWQTVEEPLQLADTLRGTAGPERAVLVDCLTLWLANLMAADRQLDNDVAGLIHALPDLAGPVIFVSNEVGQGIVPENALARRFRDAAGVLNQAVAKAAGRVVLMSAGLPLTLKDQ